MAGERATQESGLGASRFSANRSRKLVSGAHIPVADAQQSGDRDRREFCRTVFLDFIFVLEQRRRILVTVEKFKKIYRVKNTQLRVGATALADGCADADLQ